MTSMKNVRFLHLPSLPFFYLSEWVRTEQKRPSPGRRNLGCQPPPTLIPLGILATYRLYLINVSTTCKARATHNSLQLKINLN